MSLIRHLGRLALCFVVLVIGMAAAVLSGCASVFDEPMKPLHDTLPAIYDHWQSSDIQPCIVTRDGTVWKMVDEVRNCKGWMPI